MKETIKQHQIDLTTIFKNFDSDRSGTLDINEFTKMIKIINARLPEQDYINLFKFFDKDGGGSITFDEFKIVL